jgi:predicted P-loop ATPase
VELDKLRASYKQVIDKYSKMNLEVENTNSNEYMAYMKNMRRIEEERKILEIRIDELVFKNKALDN